MPKPELLTHTVPKLTADILGSSQHIFINTYQINFILPPINQMPCTLHRFHHSRVTYKSSPEKARQVINSEGYELAGRQCHDKQQVALGWTEKAGVVVRLRCAAEEQAWLACPGGRMVMGVGMEGWQPQASPIKESATGRRGRQNFREPALRIFRLVLWCRKCQLSLSPSCAAKEWDMTRQSFSALWAEEWSERNWVIDSFWPHKTAWSWGNRRHLCARRRGENASKKQLPRKFMFRTGAWKRVCCGFSPSFQSMLDSSAVCAVMYDSLATPWTACSPPDSSVHGTFLAKILEWVAISSSRGSSRLRDRTHVSLVSCTGWQILYPLSHLGRSVSTRYAQRQCQNIQPESSLLSIILTNFLVMFNPPEQFKFQRGLCFCQISKIQKSSKSKLAKMSVSVKMT